MKRHWNMNHAINSKERFEKVPKRSKFELSKIENKAKKRPAVSKIHKCKFCKKTFDSTNNLRIHEQTIHDQKKQITCRYCDDRRHFQINLLCKSIIKESTKTNTTFFVNNVTKLLWEKGL